MIGFVEIFDLIKIPLFFLSIIFILFSFNWEIFFKLFKLKKYSNSQRFHANEVPRIGGILIYLFLCIIFWMEKTNEVLLFNILLSSSLIIIVGFIEDFYHCIKPSIRIITMIVCTLIFIKISNINLPIVDIPVLSFFLENELFKIVFFTFSTLVIMNGTNLIDGMNGLAPFTIISQLIALLFLSIFYGDIDFQKMILLIIFPLLIFSIFNFPFGKIFLGDAGAYFFGFINSCLIITFFGKHNDVNSLLAVFILIYPSVELLFSFIRKKINGINPFTADNNHLHSIICIHFQKKINNLNISNNLSTLILVLFWIYPLFIFFVFQSASLILFYILIFNFLYIFLYYFLFKNLE